ncbi:MAG TPA: DinB family protein [Ignavibacteriales bacterium]|nr:DinB family protein [Ignavibacteriales bacterium]
MIDKNTLTYDLECATARLAEAFGDFPMNEFNKSASIGTWSAGDIAEHLYITESYISRTLTGSVRPSDRNPMQKIPLLGTTFQDFERKFTAGKEIYPTEVPKNRDEITQKLVNNRMMLLNTIKTHDLSESCLDFIHPKFGELTRAEWIYFVIYHGERHLQQLENVRKFISL